MRHGTDGSGTGATEPEKDALNAPVFSLSAPELRSVPETSANKPVPPVTSSVAVKSSDPFCNDEVPAYVPNKEFAGVSVDAKSNTPWLNEKFPFVQWLWASVKCPNPVAKPVPVALTVGNGAQRPIKSTEAVPITLPDMLMVDA